MQRGGLRSFVRGIISKSGFTIRRLTPLTSFDYQKTKIISSLGIDLCIDGGANVGLYGVGLREFGYAGKIISIEPSSDAFRKLEARSAGDELWTAHHLAVGDRSATLELHVTANSVSSSLLKPAGNSFNDAVGAVTVKTEPVEVVRLDVFIPTVAPTASKIFLKLDVQGFEPLALAGAEGLLAKTPLIELELGIQSLYEEAGDWLSLVQILREKGYEIVAVQSNTVDAWDRTIEINALFERRG